MQKNRKICVVIYRAFALSLTFISLAVFAQPNLVVTESYLSLKKSDKVTEFIVMNKGTSTGYYIVKTVFIGQDESLLPDMTPNEEFDLSSQLNFYPKRLKIEPNKFQKVKIIYRPSDSEGNDEVQKHAHLKIEGFFDPRSIEESESTTINLNQNVYIPVFTHSDVATSPVVTIKGDGVEITKELGVEFRGKLVLTANDNKIHDYPLIMYPEIERGLISWDKLKLDKGDILKVEYVNRK